MSVMRAFSFWLSGRIYPSKAKRAVVARDWRPKPAYPARLDPGYRLLLAVLALGWRIQEPVFLRKNASGRLVYQLFLQLAPARTYFVSLPAQSEVERFVRARQLRIWDCRRLT